MTLVTELSADNLAVLNTNEASSADHRRRPMHAKFAQIACWRCRCDKRCQDCSSCKHLSPKAYSNQQALHISVAEASAETARFIPMTRQTFTQQAARTGQFEWVA